MQAIIYMWQVSACMGVFYGFYYFMLRRMTFFTLNRWYLLTTLLLSFAIPLLTITVHQETAPVVMQKAVFVNEQLPTSHFEFIAPVQTAAPAVNWLQLIELAYLVITIVLLLKLLFTVARFYYKLKDKTLTKMGQVFILKGDNILSNGSFFNYILLADDNLSAAETEQVIAHELLHVKLLHSADRVIAKLAQVVVWFNPFVYRYARAIEENHEFEVDAEIAKQADKGRYADMLLQLSVSRHDTLFNSFSAVPLKRRITMLFTKPTNHMKKTIYLLALPVFMVSCLAFATFKKDVGATRSRAAKIIAGLDFKGDVKALAEKATKALGLKPNIEKERYSAIPGVDLLLGSTSEITVVIDGKTYDKEIAYKISASCIKSAVVRPMAPTKKIDGQAANGTAQLYDGKFAAAKIIIKTVNGQITYMTDRDRENLVKERETSRITEFYSRIHLIDNKGKAYDKAIVRSLIGSTDITLSPKEKVLFSIDGVYYNENDIRFIDQRKLSEIMVTAKVSARPVPMKPGEFAKGIGAVFTIETKPLKYTDDTTRKAAQPAKPESPSKTDDADDDKSSTAGEKKVVSRAMEDPAAPFFSRFHFTRNGKQGNDVIAFKIGAIGGSADLPVDSKAAAFIDGKFYNEDALKKVSAEKAAQLEFGSEPDRTKREKVPEGGNYAMPFSFRTKSTTAPNNGEKVGKVNESPEARKARKVDSAKKVYDGMIAQEVLNRSHYPRFYDRIKFTAFDGKDYDFVVCTVGTGLVTAPVKLDAKIGILIDGVFYNEDALKKLPDNTAKKLENWYDGLDPKKAPQGYIAALSLRIKKN